MPLSEDLDPTTARLVAELASSIVPQLSKSLSAAIPANDFSSTLERVNNISQDTRAQIERTLRLVIDESRAGQSVVVQMLGKILEEISSLRRSLDKMPATIDAVMKDNAPKDNTSAIFQRELEKISGEIQNLSDGVKNFFEVYAQNTEQKTFESINYAPDNSEILTENNSRLEKLINNALPNLEGIIKAQSKSQSLELDGFSREISTLHEQNNIALIHEVRETISNEFASMNENFSGEKNQARDEKNSFLLKIIAGMSGACMFLLVIAIAMIYFR